MEEEAIKKASTDKKEKSSNKKKGNANTSKKDEDIENRLTGYQQFSGKIGLLNMEEIEKAADQAENEPSNLNVEALNVDEDLFDDEEDLDDLDFDSDEDIDI